MPLGTSVLAGGVNFALLSRHAQRVDLLLYANPADVNPVRTIPLGGAEHRTGDVWHAFVPGCGAGQAYAYRVDGRERTLLDPNARALHGAQQADFRRALPGARGDDGPFMPRCLVVDDAAFDWGADRPPRTPWSRTVIYEMHVRGFSADPSSGVKEPGSFAGVAQKIPYLTDLGITAVELLPVTEPLPVVEADLHREGAQRANYWGYDPIALFAPRALYAPSAPPGGQVEEFKRMVRALHEAGVEVLLDLVFNHTGEAGREGPAVSYRGLDENIYYLVDPKTGGYLDFSGCGNTLNCNHPIVRDHIIDCLRYWVAQMHVDGFRFDLATIMGRDESGAILANPPILERIAEDPVLRHVKLIAEAWDAAGAYEVGVFGSFRWSEWNGRFRDDVRRFWRGDAGMRAVFASRLCGSADLYERAGKQPRSSINFVTSHDGFTLNDLVSYERKHNEENGEGNRDGSDQNYSAGYGAEGETGDPQIERLRSRQIANFIATLLLSRGVPMLLGGDEFRRTQRGNNNAYCADDPTSWYDWGLLERHRQLAAYTKAMIGFRNSHPVLCEERFYRAADLRWFDANGNEPDWYAPDAALGMYVRPSAGTGALCLLFNAADRPREMRAPQEAALRTWRAAIDTAAALENAVREPARAPAAAFPLVLEPRCLTVLEEFPGDSPVLRQSSR